MQGSIVLEILGGMIWASVMLLVLWVIYKLIADFWLFDVIHEEFENLWSVLGLTYFTKYLGISILVNK